MHPNFSALIKNRATTIQLPNWHHPHVAYPQQQSHPTTPGLLNHLWPNYQFWPRSWPRWTTLWWHYFISGSWPKLLQYFLTLRTYIPPTCSPQIPKSYGWIPSPNMEWSCPFTYNWSQHLALQISISQKRARNKTPQCQGNKPFHRLHLDLMQNPFCYWSDQRHKIFSLSVHCYHTWQTDRLDWSPDWKHNFHHCCPQAIRTPQPHPICPFHLHWRWISFRLNQIYFWMHITWN